MPCSNIQIRSNKHDGVWMYCLQFQGPTSFSAKGSGYWSGLHGVSDVWTIVGCLLKALQGTWHHEGDGRWCTDAQIYNHMRVLQSTQNGYNSTSSTVS